MGDEVDIANSNVELQTQIAIDNIRKQIKPVVFTGYCQTCGEDVEHPRRWCNAECRDAK